MNFRTVPAAVTLVTVLAGCGGGDAPPSDAPASQPAAAPAASAPAAFDAKGTFDVVCATCHGTGGLGDGPAGIALDPRPASFADPAFWETRDDETLFRAIKEGGAAVGRSPLMAPWGASFTDEQINAFVDYVKTFRPQ